MRSIININKGWAFLKDMNAVPAAIPEIAEAIDLPHSWNAIDGQDGGNDYFRGTCCYLKQVEELPEAEKYYLEIRGANSSADVYLDGEHLAHHDGGYSTWRVDITKNPKGMIGILVDNAANEKVYPQVADFTFYGGIYRDVNIICVGQSHFDLDYYGGPGIQVTPTMDGPDARTIVEVFVTNPSESQTVRYTMINGEGENLAVHETAARKLNFRIKNAHLWHGRKDPYLYSVKAELLENGEVIDTVSTRFGCRSYKIDPEKGFILNGESYPLRGVSRHQDRWGIGNALLPEHHTEDMDLICEVGATTDRKSVV